jgi:hypothetical protein
VASPKYIDKYDIEVISRTCHCSSADYLVLLEEEILLEQRVCQPGEGGEGATHHSGTGPLGLQAVIYFQGDLRFRKICPLPGLEFFPQYQCHIAPPIRHLNIGGDVIISKAISTHFYRWVGAVNRLLEGST